ncbi:hypothetical protein CH333_07030 [candidate division WOR-3 bacterium JGI_Cruoil_03_44_89]|uniref:Uncharacterized protein n=1 Tax=candidate division WOR-3 bacterium JGI_Cruoil_03_44_89 TaxID=1973748 RepID=A0A235BRS5_UNCW3|nr:MAG: hypothetical protein CH333_07030 [candidate division WOR-3 bacterium JGI_Cruoil_03_44_89]
MNKLFAISGLLFVLSLFGEEGVAVSYFEASGDIPEPKIELYTNFLVGELAAHYELFIIQGKKKAVENIWEDGEITDILALKKMGKDLKATYVLTGWLEKLPNVFLMKLAVVSAKKGEVVLRRELKCESEPEIISGIKDFVCTFAGFIERQFPSKRINQEARGSWAVGEAFFTLGWYGWAIPRALGVTDGKVIIASEMTLPLAVLIGGLSATKMRPVTSTHAIGSLGGAYLGIADGYCLNSIFDIAGEQGSLVLPVGMSLLENIGGFSLADKFDITAGEAEYSVLSAGEGYLYGLGFGELFDVKSHSGRALLALGTRLPSQFIGYKIASIREYTPADGEIITTAGLLGAATTCDLLFQLGIEDDDSYIGGAMLGNIAGAAIMDRINGERHFSRGNGILAYTGAYLGALFGTGLNVLFEVRDEKTLTMIPNLTAIAGFVLTYNLMK